MASVTDLMFNGFARMAKFNTFGRVLNRFPRHPDPKTLEFLNSWLLPHISVEDDDGDYYLKDTGGPYFAAQVDDEDHIKGTVYATHGTKGKPAIFDINQWGKFQEIMRQLAPGAPPVTPTPQMVVNAQHMADCLVAAIEKGNLNNLPLKRQRPLFSAEKASVPQRVELLLKEAFTAKLETT